MKMMMAISERDCQSAKGKKEKEGVEKERRGEKRDRGGSGSEGN